MIEIEKVVSCPVVKATKGLIEIAPELIAQLAGAIWDKDEWMTVGLGERNENGLHVIITELWTPPNQIRRGSHVRPYKGDEPTLDEMFPEWVRERMVCGIHSHHMMSARFSGSLKAKGDGGDLSDGGICSNFASSIVVATPDSKVESKLLGFSYEAILNYDLECGEMGVSYANLMPLGVEDWPFSHKIERPSITSKVESLGDCPNILRYRAGSYSHKDKASCGVETTSNYNRAAFGSDGGAILSELPEPEKAYVVTYNGGKGSNKNRVGMPGYWGNNNKEKEEVYREFLEETGQIEDYWRELYGSYYER
jgi:hypothetical protein